jgi:hypothetical protein
LTIIGAENLSNLCVVIQKAAWDLRKPAEALRDVIKAQPGVALGDHPARIELDKRLDAVRTARRDFVAAARMLNQTLMNTS